MLKKIQSIPTDATEINALMSGFLNGKTQQGKTLAESVETQANKAFGGVSFEPGDLVEIVPQVAQAMEYSYRDSTERKTATTVGVVAKITSSGSTREEPVALGQFTRGAFAWFQEKYNSETLEVVDYADLQPRWGGRVAVKYDDVTNGQQTIKVPVVTRGLKFRVVKNSNTVVVPKYQDTKMVANKDNVKAAGNYNCGEKI